MIEDGSENIKRDEATSRPGGPRPGLRQGGLPPRGVAPQIRAMCRIAFAALSARPSQATQRSAEEEGKTCSPGRAEFGLASIVPARNGIRMQAAGQRFFAP